MQRGEDESDGPRYEEEAKLSIQELLQDILEYASNTRRTHTITGPLVTELLGEPVWALTPKQVYAASRRAAKEGRGSALNGRGDQKSLRYPVAPRTDEVRSSNEAATNRRTESTESGDKE